MANPCAWPRGVQARGDRHISALNPQKFPLCLPAGGGLGEASCLGPCKASTGGTRGWDRSRIHVAVVPRGCVPPSLSPGCGDISCPTGKDANPRARGCVLTPPPVCSTDPTARHPLPKWGPLHPPWSPHIPAAGPPPSYLVVPQVQWGRSSGLAHPKTLQTTPKQHKPLPGTEIPQLQMGFLVWVPQNHCSPSSSSPQGCPPLHALGGCSQPPGCFQALADRCHLGSNLGWICPEMG